MEEREILTPAKLRERLQATRAAAARSWYRLSMGSGGAARRQLHIGGEAGHIVLSRNADDKEPDLLKVRLSRGEAKSLARSGFLVEETTAPKGDGKLSLKRLGKKKADDIIAEKLEKKKVDDEAKKAAKGGN
jgi:hypothetical protein